MTLRARFLVRSLGLMMGSVAYLAAQLPTEPGAPKAPPPLFKGERQKKDDRMRQVAGVVRDADDMLVGSAVVKVKDMKSLAIRSFITKENGQYSFQGLSTGVDYELSAETRDGSVSPTRILSVYDSRREAVINFKLDSKKK